MTWKIPGVESDIVSAVKDTIKETTMKRKQAIQKGILASGRLMLLGEAAASESAEKKTSPAAAFPLVISTWAPNVKANAAAWEILKKGSRTGARSFS